MTSIKEFIRSRKLTQRAVAERIGLAQPTLNRWLHGYIPLKDSYLQKLSEVLNITLEEVQARVVHSRN